MNSIERFLKTIAREQVDRPATWLGLPDAGSLPGLYKHFGVAGFEELKRAIDDDVWTVELPYDSPYSKHIYDAFPFAKDVATNNDERTLTTPGVFEDCENVAEVDKFDWPNPELYICPEKCRQVVADTPVDKAILGILWSAHFQDTCAAFGMENALMTMASCPEVFEAINNRIVDFYLKANEIFYENTKGKLHAVLIGNDLGTQQGLMISPAMVRQFVLPGAEKLVKQAHSYGLKVIYHSCGGVTDIFDDLVQIGVDVLHPIQALAVGMEPARLKRDFVNASFCGGVCTQELLVNGTPEIVAAKVRELRELFPTGLIISPSHEAILPDIAPANIEALFKASKE